ncbi:MAG: DUF711 family protein [Chloroflexi bacterium]|nr:DUF711 family protein [Chloroflexota bacterium]
MNIRSITYFTDSDFPLDESRIAYAGRFLGEARQAFEAAGFNVQTTRLALPPLWRTFGKTSIGEAVKYAQDLEAICFVHSIDYASLGVARPSDPAAYYDMIPDVIAATQNIFVAGVIASPLSGISLQAIQLAAKIIHRCAAISPDGLGNLRFAALANVEPGIPFMPSGYHEGGPASFGIATESADLAVTAFTGVKSLAEARSRLIESIEDQARRIHSVAKKIGGAKSVRFAGIDFSPAPFPSSDKSIGTAIEALGVGAAGASGTLAAAAFITDALQRARFQRIGFSGLFLPVLEDNVLAARSAEGLMGVSDLLLYSAVCGTGLDTVPLPGDISPAELAPILLDVAALALRLNKPLTARLMPMPGKQAGDELSFSFPFFANGRVLAHKSRPLGGALGGDEAFDLAHRAT